MKVDVLSHLLPIELVKSMIPSLQQNGVMFQESIIQQTKLLMDSQPCKESVDDKEWLFGSSFLYENPSKWPEQHF